MAFRVNVVIQYDTHTHTQTPGNSTLKNRISNEYMLEREREGEKKKM